MIRFETINDQGRALADTIKAEDIHFDGEAIVFIGSLGICVRKILTLVNDKYTDPAVVCIDTTGRYVIPVLSGHVGGANSLAQRIARIIGAEAVITTQSDNSGLWPLDTIAQRFSWNMVSKSRKDMNATIATFVNKRPTALLIESNEDEGTKYLETSCPEHVTLFHSFEDYTRKSSLFELLIIVSPYIHNMKGKQYIQYCPQCLHLGMGCQKNVLTTIAAHILDAIRAHGYAPESVKTVNTIELKKDEPMLEELCRLMPQATLCIHPAEALAKIDIPTPSEKVFEVTGCYGVAESSALAATSTCRLAIEKQKGCINTEDKTHHYTWALAEEYDNAAPHGHIEIVGAGPGDPELVSVRGRRFLEKADLILYAGSLVPVELTECAKSGATVRSSAGMDLEEQFSLMKSFYDQGKLVVRLHTGDPCIYGAIQEQMAFFDRYGMHYHITPGISSFLAAAAELRSQFTIPEKCQTIILTRGEGRTPMPEKEKLHMLAQHQSTMCIFLSANIVDEVQKELLDGGYPPETPVAACYKLTWNEQKIYRGHLKDLSRILKENNLTLTTMIVVGEAIDNRNGLSKLYDGHFTHMFRKGKQ